MPGDHGTPDQCSEIVVSVKCNSLTISVIQKVRAANGEHALSVSVWIN